MIEMKSEQMEKAVKMLSHIPDAAPEAMAKAINRAADAAKTAAARKVRETYLVRHKDVVDTLKISKAGPTKLIARVTSVGNLFPLTRFRVTPKQPQPVRAAAIRWKKGKSFAVTARVKRGEGGPIKSAFVARMKSGHLGVFRRTTDSRGPIEQMYGPSVPQMLDSKTVSEWVYQKAAETMDQRLDHEITRILEANR